MTRDRDFKQVVRDRMAETGESYTAALAAVRRQPDPRYDAALAEQRRTVGRLFTDGRIAAVPARRKVRVAVLLEVLTRFEPGRTYPEREVNDLLRPAHEDVAYLRRELVACGYVEREEGRYRLVDRAPERTAAQRRELPAWEAVWLPAFLAGR